MSGDIDSVKRKLLIKYPSFGSIIANLEFQESKKVASAGTDGKVVLYNPKFVNGLTDKEMIFLFIHEICHVAFEHISRSEGKDKRIWNIATDSVINALLKRDGLQMIDGAVDIPEAVNYDAEEMYNKLLKEQQSSQDNQEEQSSQDNREGQNSQDNQEGQSSQDNQEEQSSQDNQEGQNSQDNQEEQSSQDNQEGQNSQDNQDKQSSQGSQEQQGSQGNEEQQADVGHDTHSLWEKAIEERKKERENKKTRKSNEKKDDIEQLTEEFVQKGEKEIFKQNKIEKRKQLQELSRELAKQSSHEAGTGIQRQGKKLDDIGIATPLIDWRKFLRQAVKFDEEWTRKNARMRNGYFRHRVEEISIPETEILLDTSGSVSETLLRNFLRECKNILANSKVKVGCFNTEFHGFTELRRVEDIDNMEFPIGGGTDFNAAVEAFSRRVPNKIIFTDGEASMPEKTVKNVIWVVFGNEKINPKGGKVINIDGEQLKRLYRFMQDDKSEDMSR
mgnify:FL=1